MWTHWTTRPKTLALAPLLIILLSLVACGAAATATSAPTATSPPAPTAAPASDTGGAKPTPGRQFVATAQPSPTPAPQVASGEVVAEKIIFVINSPTTSSSLDCRVTGSGTAQHRPASEYLIDINRFTGEFEPMLATEWSVSEDARTWNFKLRQGVPWHFDFGEFTSADVVNALNYYTADGCKASYSDYYRNNPQAIPEVVSDYEINFRMGERPELIFDYWISGYRGLPLTPKAQWDQGCPGGAAEYSGASEKRPDLAGYCVAGEAIVEERPSRTGPYQLVSFQEFQNWVYERVPYDHYRVNPDFRELEIKIIKEPATRLATMLAREAQLGEIDRALIPEAIASGLAVSESQSTAVVGDMVFGGMYYDQNLAVNFDPNVPWAQPGEAGKKVRMAMNKAIDRDLIRDAIFDGYGVPGRVARFTSAFPGGYNPEWENSWEELYGYDPERARALLAEAGYPNGFDIPMISYTMSGIPEMRDYVEAIAGMWEAIGLRPELIEMEFARWREKYRSVETTGHVYPFRSYAAPAHPTVHFAYSQERFMRFYTSDTVTENIVSALDSTNIDDQNKRWAAITDEIFYNVGTIPLYSFNVQTVYDPDVVAEYSYLGNYGGQFTSMEYIKGVRR